ncbi:hypothetical protein E4U21_005783 [Claviceps maximensis]|nr:hypothetical protein E4U21_005783 [Claviceps maximensis]
MESDWKILQLPLETTESTIMLRPDALNESCTGICVEFLTVSPVLADPHFIVIRLSARFPDEAIVGIRLQLSKSFKLHRSSFRPRRVCFQPAVATIPENLAFSCNLFIQPDLPVKAFLDTIRDLELYKFGHMHQEGDHPFGDRDFIMYTVPLYVVLPIRMGEFEVYEREVRENMPYKGTEGVKRLENVIGGVEKEWLENLIAGLESPNVGYA